MPTVQDSVRSICINFGVINNYIAFKIIILDIISQEDSMKRECNRDHNLALTSSSTGYMKRKQKRQRRNGQIGERKIRSFWYLESKSGESFQEDGLIIGFHISDQVHIYIGFKNRFCTWFNPFWLLLSYISYKYHPYVPCFS